MTLFISENGVSWGAHLSVQPGPDAYTGSGDQGRIQHQETVPGTTEKCSSQVGARFNGQSVEFSLYSISQSIEKFRN